MCAPSSQKNESVQATQNWIDFRCRKSLSDPARALGKSVEYLEDKPQTFEQKRQKKFYICVNRRVLISHSPKSKNQSGRDLKRVHTIWTILVLFIELFCVFEIQQEQYF